MVLNNTWQMQLLILSIILRGKMLKNKLVELLKLAKCKILEETANGIKLNSFIFIFKKEGLSVYYDIGLYPDEAAKMTILIYEFCKTYNIKFFIGESYIEKDKEFFYGRDAADKYLVKNYVEMENIRAWEKFLEKSSPKDLHAC